MASRHPLLPLIFTFCIINSFTSPAVADSNHGDGHHFVLVHGLGHGAWCWYKIATLLRGYGSTVTTIDLTSNGNSKVVADTVTSVAAFVKPLTDYLASLPANQKVVLVGHSLGGCSITYVMELFPHKIEKAIFLAALMPSNGQNFVPTETFEALVALFQQGVLIQSNANGDPSVPTSISINLATVKDFFYNESPTEDVNLASTLLNPTPFAPALEPLTLTTENYGSIKRYYVKTPLDNVIVPALQANVIQQNPPYQVFTLPSSDHSPFFSRPRPLANLLLSIASS